MEVVRHEIPFDSEGYLSLLGRIFGEEEAELERIQVNGSESAFNRDIAFTAEEDGKVYGTSHFTVPVKSSRICGLSGLCTDPAIRGNGMGKKLFAALVEEADANGAEVSYLGTNNPMASVMYASFGYAYIPGTYVMARFSGTDRYHFYKSYGSSPEGVEIRKLDPGMRIGVIPLLTNEGPGYLLDSNTGIFNNRFISQQSTMGLYPRFLEVASQGGEVFQAVSSDGVLGGVATLKREPERALADFFCMESFRPFAKDLIGSLQKAEPELFFRISEADTEKQEILMDLGYKKEAEETVSYGDLQLVCGLWK